MKTYELEAFQGIPQLVEREHGKWVRRSEAECYANAAARNALEHAVFAAQKDLRAKLTRIREEAGPVREELSRDGLSVILSNEQARALLRAIDGEQP